MSRINLGTCAGLRRQILRYKKCNTQAEIALAGCSCFCGCKHSQKCFIQHFLPAGFGMSLHVRSCAKKAFSSQFSLPQTVPNNTQQTASSVQDTLDKRKARHTTRLGIPVVPWKLSGDATLREWLLLLTNLHCL